MINILRILNQIPEKTFKRFSLFLKSPYHNSNKQLIRILKFRQKKISTLEKISSTILGREIYNEQVIRNLLSELNKKFQKFLIVDQIEEESTIGEILLIKKIKSFGINYNIDKLISSVKNKSNKLKDIPTLLLQEELFGYQLEMINKDDSLNIKAIIETEYLFIKESTFLSKINFYCTYITLQNVKPNFIRIKNIENKISQFKIPIELKKTTLANLYFQAFSLLKEPNTSNFKKLDKSLHKNIDILHKDHVKFILSILSSYCVQYFNFSDRSLSLKHYEYLKLEIAFNDEEIIPFHQIINFTIIGCKQNKYHEVLSILKERKSKVNKNAYVYSNALIYFYDKKFNIAIKLLSSANFNNVKLNINSRLLLTKIYLAQKEYEVALNCIETLRIFILRSTKIENAYKKRNIHYLKFLKASILLKEKKVYLASDVYNNEKSTLYSKIQNSKQFNLKSFLIEFLEKED